MNRIQRKRTSGWRKPAGAIDCTRPGRWGNSYRIRELLAPERGFVVVDMHGIQREPVHPTKEDAARQAIELFERNLRTKLAAWPEYLEPLRGHDLMCWCTSGQTCHVDVLLRLAEGAVVT